MRAREKVFRDFRHVAVIVIAPTRVDRFAVRVATASRVVIVGVAPCTRPCCDTAAPVDERAGSGTRGGAATRVDRATPSSRARAELRARLRVVGVLTCTYV
jgi:hypothetical protein